MATCTPTEPLIRVRQLTRRFGEHTVLDRLDLDIERGAFVALLGRSGSGKSTLLRMLARLDSAPAGTVQVPDKRAVVFQEPRLVPWKTVEQNLALGLRKPDARAVIAAALKEVGVAHRLDAWPLTLSGGEAQRVALARALVRDPKVWLLDEPFAALDALTRIQMQRLIAQVSKAHDATVLLVTHDVDEALLLADRVVMLEHGRIGSDIEIDLPRPRRPTDPAFAALRERLLAALGVAAETA
ncbi:ABC transporter ATP-binding protein [Caballeronia sp. LZ032]|uniref:ABC transporter ATP-binding protein n=1 Tax=Caballeronia sp. LZ032 TaxID=3038565 RepID=UPI002855DF87|nr:ABC transporter ATP-binding protein [Caballeronia sp. LZ032]MDR5880710.1 ABC transporter ATP-binding protein [Caballeronia sp. LZ032]